jgi:hypothetical protein
MNFNLVNDLMKILREDRHLPVNVVHSPRNDNEPLTSEFQPRMAISDLKLVEQILFRNVNITHLFCS